jgi:hypothetical protein
VRQVLKEFQSAASLGLMVTGRSGVSDVESFGGGAWEIHATKPLTDHCWQ